MQPVSAHLRFMAGHTWRDGHGLGPGQAGNAVNKGQASGKQTHLYRHRQVQHHGQHKHRQQGHTVGQAKLPQLAEGAPIAHVPGHKHQNGRQSGQGHVVGQRGGHPNHHQQSQGVHHARHWAGGTTFGVGHGAGNGAGGRHAPEKWGDKVGHALGHQLLVGVVAVANHAVGHAGAQQRFNRPEQSQGEGGHDQGLGAGPAELGPHPAGQVGGNATKAAANGLQWQAPPGGECRGQYQHHDGAGQTGHATHPRRRRVDQAPSPRLPRQQHQHARAGQAQCPGVEVPPVVAQGLQNAPKVGRHVGHVQAQKIFDLRQRHQHRNAIGETNHHGHGDEADQVAQLEQAHGKQQHARHRGGQDQVGHAMALHNAVDDDDEGARWPANLHPAAAQQRNQKAGNDGGEQTGLRAQA